MAPAASKPAPLPVSSTPSCTKLRTRYRRPNYCESPPPGYFSDTSNYSTDPTPTKWHCPGIFFNYVPPITPTLIPSTPIFLSEPGLFDNWSDDDSSTESSLFKDSSDEHESISTRQLPPPPNQLMAPAGQKRANRMQCTFRWPSPLPVLDDALPLQEEDGTETVLEPFVDESPVSVLERTSEPRGEEHPSPRGVPARRELTIDNGQQEIDDDDGRQGLEDELDTVNSSIATVHYRISFLKKRVCELEPRRDWIRRKLRNLNK